MTPFEKAYKAIERGGKQYLDCFEKAKLEKRKVSADEALLVTDVYGLEPFAVYMIAFSHGVEIDVEGYQNIIQERSKEKTRICPAIRCFHISKLGDDE